VRVKKTGELFPGNHEPLVSKSLFDRVQIIQIILRGKTVNRIAKHDFTFRRTVRCAGCKYSLIGELQKGRVYYRCHTSACPTNTVREDQIDEKFAATPDGLKFDPEEMQQARLWVSQAHMRQDTFRKEELQKLTFRLNQIRPRLERLTDAFLDGTIERELFENRKNALLLQEREVKEKLCGLEYGNGNALTRLEEFLELVNRSDFLYENALPEEKRDLLKKLTSNLKAIEKNVTVELKSEAQLLFQRSKTTYGAPYKGVPRTLDAVLTELLTYFSQNQAAAN
jgi:site-specific DNA recombinase